jgi:uncharacterized membrane protein YgdD (TMEM256/DUF423 family)
MNLNTISKIAALSGAIAVGLGAMGAHALKPLIQPHRLDYFEKAVQYHFTHTIALLLVAVLMFQLGQNKWLKVAAWGFLLGIICFCGSLYGLAIVEIVPIPTAILGPITPIGGVFFIIGWVSLFFGADAVRGV